MKKALSLIMAIMMVSALTSCSQGKTIKASYEDIYSDISSKIDLKNMDTIPNPSGELMLGMTTKEYFITIMGLDLSLVKDYLFGFSTEIIKPDTIMMVTVDNEEALNSVVKVCEAYVRSKKEQFESSTVLDYEINYETTCVNAYEGKYVLMVISPDRDRIVQIFESYLK